MDCEKYGPTVRARAPVCAARAVPVVTLACFTEGFETPDLVAGTAMLAQLR